MVKLHLGCGPVDFGKEWYHIDAEKYPHVKDFNIVNLGFPDDSVDLIYASHVLEYFSREAAERVLKEWLRVLKPFGKLRIAVPDFAAMAKLYTVDPVKYPLASMLGPLYGKIIVGGEFLFHKTVYDYASLWTLLMQVGFAGACRYDWRDTEHAHIDDCSRAHLPHDPEAIRTGNFNKHNLISLNVEAIK